MPRPSLVSVVVPCHNGAASLTGAVQSVRTQFGPSMEVIVVDDASTDDSAAVAAQLAVTDPSVRIIRRATNGGPAAARNTGLRAADGRYVCFLDADPTVAGLVTGVELLDCHRSVDPVQLDALTRSVPTNLLVRRAAVDLLGGFSEDPRFRGPLGGEDIAFRTALSRHFCLARTDHPYLRHRFRPGGHLDRFLDRSVVDGKLVFTRPTPDESSGAFSAALTEYLDRVRDRVGTRDATGSPEPDAPAPWIVDPRCANMVTTPTPRPTSGPEPGAEDPADLIKTGVALAQQGRVAEPGEPGGFARMGIRGHEGESRAGRARVTRSERGHPVRPMTRDHRAQRRDDGHEFTPPTRRGTVPAPRCVPAGAPPGNRSRSRAAPRPVSAPPRRSPSCPSGPERAAPSSGTGAGVPRR